MANPLLKALQQMSSGMRMVDIGDMAAKPNVGARVQAVQRMLSNATEAIPKVSDWGWKGAPKGKLSADDYIKIKEAAQEAAWIRAQDYLEREIDENDVRGMNIYYQDLEEIASERLLPIAKQWVRGGLPDYLVNRRAPGEKAISASVDDTDEVADAFKSLQNADIPWEYTGKVFKALAARDNTPIPEISSVEAYAISKAMEPMTHDQRSDFLSLLSDWEGSMEDLADAVVSL